jgi:hypothetical protein
MKYLLLVVGFLIALSANAQEKKDMKRTMADKEGTVALSGYVVDAMCAQGMLKKSDPMAKAAAHTRHCALEDDCASSGYGVFSDGKYYKFDEKGDKMAKELIEKTSTQKGIMVDVMGSMKGETLAVASVKEHKAMEESKSKSN